MRDAVGDLASLAWERVTRKPILCESTSADPSDQVPLGTGRSIFHDDILFFRMSSYFSRCRSIFHDVVLFFATLSYISGRRSIFRHVVLFLRRCLIFEDDVLFFTILSCFFATSFHFSGRRSIFHFCHDILFFRTSPYLSQHFFLYFGYVVLLAAP